MVKLAYEKQNFKDGDILTAEQLNHIEDGIDTLGVVPDLSVNDESDPAYVKNRPFYQGDPVETVLLEESTVSFTNGSGGILSTFEAVIGDTYTVYWDGTVYERQCFSLAEDASIQVIGNKSIVGAGSDTGEPFLMVISPDGIRIFTEDTSDSHTFSISVLIAPVVTIDSMFLPDDLATKQDVEVTQAAADKNKEMFSQMFTSVAIFTFDKQTSGRDTFKFNDSDYYKISDFNPSPSDVISFKGTKENGSEASTTAVGNNCVQYGGFIVVASAGDCSIPISDHITLSFTAPSAGLYALYTKEDSGMTAGMGEFTMRFPIGILLRSSGSYSTKKFKITVDDSGTLTATEITE